MEAIRLRSKDRALPDHDRDGGVMQDHHRKLIEQEAEAWKADAHLHGTTRSVSFIDIRPTRRPAAFSEIPHLISERAGLLVTLEEATGHLGGAEVFARRTTNVRFLADEMPLTARMVRDRFANPFGGKP